MNRTLADLDRVVAIGGGHGLGRVMSSLSSLGSRLTAEADPLCMIPVAVYYIVNVLMFVFLIKDYLWKRKIYYVC